MAEEGEGSLPEKPKRLASALVIGATALLVWTVWPTLRRVSRAGKENEPLSLAEREEGDHASGRRLSTALEERRRLELQDVQSELAELTSVPTALPVDEVKRVSISVTFQSLGPELVMTELEVDNMSRWLLTSVEGVAVVRRRGVATESDVKFMFHMAGVRFGNFGVIKASQSEKLKQLVSLPSPGGEAGEFTVVRVLGINEPRFKELMRRRDTLHEQLAATQDTKSPR